MTRTHTAPNQFRRLDEEHALTAAAAARAVAPRAADRPASGLSAHLQAFEQLRR